MVCRGGTINTCLRLGLFGIIQDAYVPIVQHIRPGMPVSSPPR